MKSKSKKPVRHTNKIVTRSDRISEISARIDRIQDFLLSKDPERGAGPTDPIPSRECIADHFGRQEKLLSELDEALKSLAERIVPVTFNQANTKESDKSHFVEPRERSPLAQTLVVHNLRIATILNQVGELIQSVEL